MGNRRVDEVVVEEGGVAALGVSSPHLVEEGVVEGEKRAVVFNEAEHGDALVELGVVADDSVPQVHAG